MSTMPMYFPQNFALGTAVECAELVNCAYDQYTQWYDQDYPDMSGFSWVPSISGYDFGSALYWTYSWLGTSYQEPIGFVAWSDDTAYVVFRGTVSKIDWLYDAKTDLVAYAQTSGFGNVHEGFSEIYAQLSPQVLAGVGEANKAVTLTNVIFTGHSLGSGLSSLAVPDVVANAGLAVSVSYLHLNLASPRVGDPTYAAAMNASAVPSFRVVNTEDIVPCAPLAVGIANDYEHIGTPINFTANYGAIDGNHSLTLSYLYALSNPQSPQNPSPPVTLLEASIGPAPIGGISDGQVGGGATFAAALIAARGPVSSVAKSFPGR